MGKMHGARRSYKREFQFFQGDLNGVFSGVASTQREGRNSIHGGFCHE
jgi:hypothetical protein